MFHLIAYDEARADAVTDLSPLDGVEDDTVRVIGDDIYIPDVNFLIGVYFFHGTAADGNPTRGQLSSPSLRGLILPDIARCHKGGDVLSEKMIEMFPTQPIELAKNEALNALMTNGAVTGARGICGVWLADKAITPVSGDIRTIHATSTLTGVANQWTSGSISFDQDLPVGRYQVVGARCVEGANAGLFRLIFTGYQWRPGGVVTNYLRNPDLDIFRRGKLGVWGEFDQLTPPHLEVLMVDAASNPELYLDLIKVA